MIDDSAIIHHDPIANKEELRTKTYTKSAQCDCVDILA